MVIITKLYQNEISLVFSLYKLDCSNLSNFSLYQTATRLAEKIFSLPRGGLVQAKAICNLSVIKASKNQQKISSLQNYPF